MCRRKRGLANRSSPVDRGRRGSKQHLLVDGSGLPLAWTLTGGNRNDITELLVLLDAVPPVRGRVGRPRRRPDTVVADRGYDHDKYRRLVWRRGVKPLIARRLTEHAPGSAVTVGSSNAPSPGCTTAAGCWFAPTAATNTRSIPRPRLLPHLLAKAGDLIQLELLREKRGVELGRCDPAPLGQRLEHEHGVRGR